MALKALVFLAAIAFANGQHWGRERNFHQYPQESQGDVKEKLKTRPSPMPGFNLLPWLGPWFFQFHKSPCSWAIAEDFTDFTQITELQGRTVINHETMRNSDLCNSVTSVLSVTGRPGEFIGKDPVGNNWSGRLIVVATDYKGFAMSWGCTKFSVFDDRCEDPMVYIKTRKLRPRPGVLRRIEMALQSIFGISINQLSRIRHGRPCSFGCSSGGKKARRCAGAADRR